MSESLKGKKILFAVTGGIAAYKAPDILNGWIKEGCEVEVVITKAAESFVSSLALSTLCKRRVWHEDDFFTPENGYKIPHISLTEWADVFVIAPATANAVRIAAEGDSSTLIGSALIACRKPVVLFPAMNTNMYDHPTTQRNIARARGLGYEVVEPISGILACGWEGKGKLPPKEVIYEYVRKALCAKKDLAGKKILVTAGPTHEFIDPVRFMSNPSTGKMGYAIAKSAWYRGADVTLVSGPTKLDPPVGINFVSVTSAEEMYNACMAEQADSDIIIKAAAVGDFKAAKYAPQKIKRSGIENYSVTFAQNKDIAAELGKTKKAGQVLVGFAAETENLIENARKKIVSKNLDMVVMNDVSAKDAGFACDTNSISIICADGRRSDYSGTKDEAADVILDAAAEKTA